MEKNIVTQRLTIKLSEFEGPLDLLLHLIKKAELDIFDLPIAVITEQYLSFIQKQQSMQLDVASEYLVMAATLVQIKSSDLLPNDTIEVDDIEVDFLDPKETLMLQLLTYKQFQVASESLRERENTNQQSFSRLPSLSPEFNQMALKPLAPGLELIDLQVAFEHLLRKKRQQQPISRRVVSEKFTLTMAFDYIAQQLQGQPRGAVIAFDDLFENMADKEAMVMIFLALLEMAKETKISFHQADASADIFLEIETLSDDE